MENNKSLKRKMQFYRIMFYILAIIIILIKIFEKS